MPVFTPEARERVRAGLLRKAAEDPRIAAAAITGSAARGDEDRWSDIDLFLGVTGGAVSDVVQQWSDFVYGELDGIHHFDVHSGPAIYRAFLLPDLLEIDLGFTPAGQFGARGPGAFHVVFGTPAEPKPNSFDAATLIGYSWHHVRHARACLDRGRPWQAEYWISGIRDHVLTLAAARLGEDVDFAKGAHRLPDDVTRPLEAALVRSLDATELARALTAATRAFLRELHLSHPATAAALEPPLRDLTDFEDHGDVAHLDYV